MTAMHHRRSHRTFTLVVLVAVTGAPTDVTVPLLVLVCWALLVLALISPRRRHRTHPHDREWHAPTAGPPSVSATPTIVGAPSRDSATPRDPDSGLVTIAEPDTLPTLSDVVGHTLAGVQLDDLLGPPLRAGARSFRRPWGGLLVHGAPADAALLVRAVAGEHHVPVLTVRVPTLARSMVDTAVQDVFADARARAPCVLAIGDLDDLAARDAAEVRRVSNDLLSHLRRVEPTERVAVVGIVADVDAVPRTLVDAGGFDRAVAVGTLTAAERARMLTREVALHAAVLGGDLQASVRVTEGQTASRLRAVTARAVWAARTRSAIADHPPTVTARDLREAIAAEDSTPSVTLDAFGPTVARHLQRMVTDMDDPHAGPALVLLGAAGNGKTTAARWVVERCDRPVTWLAGADLTVLTGDDVEAVADSALDEAPSLVVIDGVDEGFRALAPNDHKLFVTTVERLLAEPTVALLLTSRERWTPLAARGLDDQVESIWLRNPSYHERAVLIQHVLGSARHPMVRTLAADLVGAARRDVAEAAVIARDQGG